MKEADIRPKIYEQFLTLSTQDAKTMLLEACEQFVDVSCPACESQKGEIYCEKNGFTIRQCPNCNSLFCSPRPTLNQLRQFYIHGAAFKFFAEEYLPMVMEKRRDELFKPKAKKIYDLLSSRHFEPKNICDVGAGHGILLEELRELWPDATLYAIELGRESAEVCRKKGFKVLEKMVEEAHEWFDLVDLVTCFEVIEHVFNLKAFIASIYRLVRKGGFCLIAGLGGEGFDIQVLGKDSNSIFPPHHLNFMSVQGFEQLFRDAGFSNVKVTTPGQLDVDRVRNTVREQGVQVPAVIQTIFNRGRLACEQLQKYLVEQKLSSHVWIFAQK